MFSAKTKIVSTMGPSLPTPSLRATPPLFCKAEGGEF